MRWRLALLLSVCFICLACASDVGRMVGASKFNTKLLNEGGLLIGGVSAKSPLTLQERINFAELLQIAFRQQSPELTTISPREVYKALGRNLYTQMLDSYQFHETGSTAFMTMLYEKFPDTRYVAYARIEASDVEHKNTKLTDNSGYELETLRGVGVSMRVFDLHSRQIQVWAAGLQQVDVNKRRVFGRYSDKQLENFYPDPPRTEKVLQMTYAGLVSALVSAR